MAGVPSAARSTSVRVLTWNIDMDTEFPMPRVRAIVDTIRDLYPPVDVIMLQELTAVCRDSHDPYTSHVVFFRDRLDFMYNLHVDKEWISDHGYFVAMLIRKNFFLQSPQVTVSFHNFPHTQMQRGYVLVEGAVANIGMVAFITSHLESEVAGAKNRKLQFELIVQLMRDLEQRGRVVIFGGDTNLRESEISSLVIAKKPIQETKERESDDAGRTAVAKAKRKISDAYIQAGAPEEKKFTWDMKKNDNLKVDWEFQPRSRYDRVFVFGPASRYPVCTQWDLIGKSKIQSCSVYPSDHWGVLVDIRIPFLPIETDGEEGDQRSSSPAPSVGVQNDVTRPSKRRKTD